MHALLRRAWGPSDSLPSPHRHGLISQPRVAAVFGARVDLLGTAHSHLEQADEKSDSCPRTL